MLFCESCQNMLYIKLSDTNSNTIINYCKHCGLESTAQNTNIIEEVEKNYLQLTKKILIFILWMKKHN